MVLQKIGTLFVIEKIRSNVEIKGKEIEKRDKTPR